MRPSRETIESVLCERHTEDIHNILNSAKVGIAGLGGLGSNIAAMLARSGIGALVIVDHDVVDLGNINRQNYYLEQLHMTKTDATEQLLLDVNPYLNLTKHFMKLSPSNIPGVFGECDIVCEAFDIPSEKAMLINTILEKCPDVKIVSGSGMAGYGRSNEITTKKIFDNLCMCGDGVDMEDRIGGLMSPRVNICAGHMANEVLRSLIEDV